MITICPQCGGDLSIHVGDPQSCPYFCNSCKYGFWVSELENRQYYRPNYHDFGLGAQLQVIQAGIKYELDEANIRGTSALQSFIPKLSMADLESLLRRKLDPGFAQLVKDQITTLNIPRPKVP